MASTYCAASAVMPTTKAPRTTKRKRSGKASTAALTGAAIDQASRMTVRAPISKRQRTQYAARATPSTKQEEEDAGPPSETAAAQAKYTKRMCLSAKGSTTLAALNMMKNLHRMEQMMRGMAERKKIMEAAVVSVLQNATAEAIGSKVGVDNPRSLQDAIAEQLRSHPLTYRAEHYSKTLPELGARLDRQLREDDALWRSVGIAGAQLGQAKMAEQMLQGTYQNVRDAAKVKTWKSQFDFSLSPGEDDDVPNAAFSIRRTLKAEMKKEPAPVQVGTICKSGTDHNGDPFPFPTGKAFLEWRKAQGKWVMKLSGATADSILRDVAREHGDMPTLLHSTKGWGSISRMLTAHRRARRAAAKKAADAE